MQLHYTHPSRLNPPTSRVKYLIPIVAVIFLVAGCTGLSVQSHITKAEGETKSIVGHADGIDQASDTIAGNEGPKKDIRTHTKGIRDDASTLLTHLAQAIRGDEANQKELKHYKEDVGHQLLEWAYGWWFWIKWGGITFVCLFGLLYVVAAIGGLFNPATAAYRIYETLDGLLPAIQPVRWLHEVMNRRTVSVPAAVVPTEAFPTLKSKGGVVEGAELEEDGEPLPLLPE